MNELSWLSIAGPAAALIFCIVQAVRDFRAKRYAWSAAATICAGLLLAMPVETHTVKIDYPASQ